MTLVDVLTHRAGSVSRLGAIQPDPRQPRPVHGRQDVTLVPQANGRAIGDAVTSSQHQWRQANHVRISNHTDHPRHDRSAGSCGKRQCRCRDDRQTRRAVEQLRRKQLATSHADQLGYGDLDGSRRRCRGRSGCFHHGRESGHRAGRTDPESHSPGLRRHRDQRRLAGRLERGRAGGLQRRHHGRLLRWHRHRTVCLAYRRGLQANGHGPGELSGRASARGWKSARDSWPCRRVRR